MASDTNSANAYLRTKVLTAPPEQLRLMLLDGAIRFATQGREAMARRDHEATYLGVSQCRDIVYELLTSIGPSVETSLAERVRALYTFLYSRLLEASTERSIPKLDEVIGLLEYERETWALFIERLHAERSGGASQATGQAASQAVGQTMGQTAGQPGNDRPTRRLSMSA
ncbi:MAG: flagellar export chaperone FliS [Phycisphaerales bacterium]